MEGTGSQLVLSQEEAFARIRLLRSPNIGPVAYRQLLARFETATAALDALPSLGSGRKRAYCPADIERIEHEVIAVREAGAAYLFHDQQDYPPLLAELESAPPILTYRGKKRLASKPCIAIVGARNASVAALQLAEEFAGAMSEIGFSVISGLARGVDGAAHRSALPSTIGVIASGIDIAYPPEHADLQEQFATQGLLVAEQPPRTAPKGRHFPSRNRIIAGIALGTVVIEAAPKSGSLITATLAGEYGREVMAVPGSPLDGRSRGCNQLIRDGAVLVQEPSDVAELLQGFTGATRLPLQAQPDPPVPCKSDRGDFLRASPTVGEIADLLSTAPVRIDELIRQSGQEPSAVQLALLELEISGELVRLSGGKVARISSEIT